MKYYFIRPYACSGMSYFTQEDNDLGISSGQLIINFDSSYIESSFFAFSGDSYYIFSEQKDKFEINFPELSFQKVDKLIFPDYLKNEFATYNRDSFLKLKIPSEGEVKDFFLYKSVMLVISERALEFLYQNNLFTDSIEGKDYGDEFTITTNKFPISGPINSERIKQFFSNEWPIISKNLEEKRKILSKMYRRDYGPPRAL